MNSLARMTLFASSPLRSVLVRFAVLGRRARSCSSPAAAVAARHAAHPPSTPPVTGQPGDEVPAGGPPLGFPVFATKNTTRVAGGDAIADAAAVALATYPARTPESRPPAVVLAEVRDWQTGHRRLRAGRTPDPRADPVRRRRHHPGRHQGRAGRAAADRLQGGGRRAGDPRGDEGAGRRLQDDRHPRGANPAALAAAVDRLQTAAAGAPSSAVVVATADRPEYAMPAAGWAAKSGNPLLWVTAHRRAAGDRGGDQDAQGGRDLRARARGRRARTRCSTRSASSARSSGSPATDAVSTAITFARYRDGEFGWYVVDPGHGLVFANTRRPQDAAAAAPLSAHGKYGPLLLIDRRGRAARSRCRTTCWTSSPATTHRPRPRRLQPRLDHRRRERPGGRRPGPHRYAPGDPARRYRSPVSRWPKPSSPNACAETARSPSTTSASSSPPPRRTSRTRSATGSGSSSRGLPADSPVRLYARREIAKLEASASPARSAARPNRTASARSPRSTSTSSPATCREPPRLNELLVWRASRVPTRGGANVLLTVCCGAAGTTMRAAARCASAARDVAR